MGTITIIIICIGALILGAALSWVVSEKLLGQKTRAILSEAEREAEVLKQKKLLEVKEKFLQLKGDLEQQVAQRNKAQADRGSTEDPRAGAHAAPQ